MGINFHNAETASLFGDAAVAAVVVPHQPSKLGLRSLRKYNFPQEQVVEIVDRFGNCVAASIPLALYEAVRRGRVHRGDEVLMVGTGAGLSLGGLIFTY